MKTGHVTFVVEGGTWWFRLRVLVIIWWALHRCAWMHGRLHPNLEDLATLDRSLQRAIYGRKGWKRTFNGVSLDDFIAYKMNRNGEEHGKVDRGPTESTRR